MRCTLAALCLLALVPHPALADAVSDAGAAPAEEKKPDEAEPSGPPAEVAVGVYVNQVTKLDLKANEYTVSFWVWFRWKGEDLKPLETFEVVGGRVESKEGEVAEELDGGVHYVAVRMLVTITKFFDISRFPLDDHVLQINIEDTDNEDHKLKFVADADNSRVDPDVQVPGWKLARYSAVVAQHGYTTNYGDTSLPTNNKSNYSRFSFSIELEREGLGYFFKLFWGGFMAALIAFMALLIKPTDLDPRFGLGVGAIFAAMASAYVISSALPETQEMTLADMMNGLAISYIFLSIVVSTVSLRLWGAGRERASQKLDRWAFVVLLLTFFYGNILIVTLH